MSATDIALARISGMGRWAPDARGRLQKAAWELFTERGFEATTVADIAARAGTTERTFFRHFDDKREVLFSGAEVFEDSFVSAVLHAPKSAAPLEAVAAGLGAAAAFLEQGQDMPRRRQAIIAANPELQERELKKLASLSAAVADALRMRGIADSAAVLTAEIGVTVFKVSFERWLSDRDHKTLSALVAESLDELSELTGSVSSGRR